MWHSLPQAELNAYETAPSATSFKLAYDKFYENLKNRTKGKFDDYAFKIFLDGVLEIKAVSEHHICTWPMDCPAYRSMLPVLFPGLAKTDYYLAACYYHRLIYKEHRFHLRDSLAQLCWVKRGAT